MKFSVSMAFFFLALSQAISTVSATSPPDNGNQQCNNNGVSTRTVTVTASDAVTKTVTVNAGATATNGGNNNGKNNGGTSNVGNNNSGNNSGTNNVGNKKGGNSNGLNNSGTNSGTNNVGNNNGGNNNGKNNSGTNNVGNNNGGNNNGKNNGGASNNNNPQTSLQLDSSVIGLNLASNGLGNGSEAGQTASLTSTNNFINACLGKTITNGQQVAAGSCNPVPMGDIPSKSNMVHCKFSSPLNFATISPNAPFKVTMNIVGMQTGSFVNPVTNYFAAPQQLNKQGQIIGHSHFVIQKIKSIQDPTPLDPTVFAFFQGVNGPAVNNEVSATVTKGLPEGDYRVSSINTAANHQPLLVPVAQHGSLDDMIYFTVSAKAGAAAASQSTSNAAAAGATRAKNGTSIAGRKMRRFMTSRMA